MSDVVNRRPTDAEFATLQSWFPQLTRPNVWITHEPTAVYNCIGYSLGVSRWINPPQPLAAFQALYNGQPYNHPTVPAGSASATIDGWALGPVMTHGSRTTTSAEAPLWESKLGAWYRITHGRHQLAGNLYGQVVTSFA